VAQPVRCLWWLNDEQGADMRKDPTFWVALSVAFVLGLLPGLGLTAYERQTSTQSVTASTAELRSRQTAWEAEKRQLTDQLTSAEANAARLESRVTSLTMAAEPVSEATTRAPSPRSSGRTPVIVNRSIDGTTQPGAPLTLTVKVKGSADRVSMRLAQFTPKTGVVKTYPLQDAGVSAGLHVWKATVDAPSAPGEYRYFADAYLGKTHVTMLSAAVYAFTIQ
jgi:hypothetical protein